MPTLSTTQRALAINAAVFTSFVAIAAPALVAMDGQPPAIALQVLAVAFVCYGIAWVFLPALSWDARRKVVALVVIITILMFLPLLIPAAARGARLVFAIFSGLLAVRLFDLYVQSERGRPADALTESLFLASSIFVLRKMPAPVNRHKEWSRFVKRAAELILMATLLVISAHLDWRSYPFLLEHAIKTTALFLTACALLNLFMSLTRLLGLFTLATGRVYGYQFAYFGIQGAAVASTLRWKPTGWVAGAAILGTLAFNLLVSVFFFVNASLIEPLYTVPIPGWLQW
ncbi:MAG: hypothetical protein ACT4O1_12385 [Gemmatimonadota bacterium]